MDINADARLKVVHMLKENLGQNLNEKPLVTGPFPLSLTPMTCVKHPQ
ncbi:MAG: hypothetical protein CM1200mP6_06340 [Anaerolineaceae bacterium]|nr:MAG: hypothetical protein CM1200mP6_06340 [Anaerolineaceae bacterium]